MTAFSTATITATSSAPQKSSMWTPARIAPATIRATAVATHETTSGNNRQRGRSGCQSVHPPEAGSGLLAITFSSCRTR